LFSKDLLILAIKRMQHIQKGGITVKKLLLWEKLHTAVAEVEKRIYQNLTVEEKELEVQKMMVLAEILEIIDYFGNLGEKTKIKYESWFNRSTSRKIAAENLGISTDALRASILYFNSRLEFVVGKDMFIEIVNCKTIEELTRITEQFRSRVSSVKKGYFR
jgi:hypothetical protein